MDITLDKKSSNEASIKVKLNEVDYQSKVDKKIKDYSKKAQINGFRPGKVPPGIIKKMYGKSILVEEINHLVGHAIQDYIKENELQILGEPLPNQEEVEKVDWDSQKDFEFEYNIGLVEDFTVDLTGKIKVPSYQIEVEDKTIDESIESIRSQYSKMTNPEVSEEGDMLYGTFEQAHGDIVHDTTIHPEELDKVHAKKFVGKKKDDVIEVDINELYKDPEVKARHLDKTVDEIEGIDSKFTFTVKNVNRKEKADLDQDLYDKVFGPDQVKNVEEFKAKASEMIGENYNRETEAFLNKTIRDTLVEKTKINLPDSFLKNWLKITGEGKVTDADLEKEYNTYADQLRWNLISGQIAKENEIKPEHEEVLTATKNMIRAQFAMSGLGQLEDQMDAFADNYLKGENGQNYMKMTEQVMEEKVMQLIKSTIEIKEEKVNLEKFKKIVEN